MSARLNGMNPLNTQWHVQWTAIANRIYSVSCSQPTQLLDGRRSQPPKQLKKSSSCVQLRAVVTHTSASGEEQKSNFVCVCMNGFENRSRCKEMKWKHKQKLDKFLFIVTMYTYLNETKKNKNIKTIPDIKRNWVQWNLLRRVPAARRTIVLQSHWMCGLGFWGHILGNTNVFGTRYSSCSRSNSQMGEYGT